MYFGKTLFSQVMEFVPWTSLARILQRHGGGSGVRALPCTEHFRAMAFAQATWSASPQKRCRFCTADRAAQVCT